MTGEAQPFSHKIESARNGKTILRLSGDLHMAASPAVGTVLHQLQHEGAQDIVIDLRGLSFLDSTGLSALMEACGAGQDGHRTESFIAGGRTVHRVFQITKMDERVTWVEPERSDEAEPV